MEVTKTNKSAQATAMVNNLRDRFVSQQNQTSDKFDTICGLLDQVGKQIEQQKRQNEQMIETKAAQLDRVQSRVADAIAEEMNIQESVDDELCQLIQERTNQLQYDIETESDLNQRTVEQLRDCLQTQIPHLYDSLKDTIGQREATEEALQKQISDEFAIVQERLA